MSRLHSNMFFQILLGFRQAIKSKIKIFLALNLSIFWIFHDKQWNILCIYLFKRQLISDLSRNVFRMCIVHENPIQTNSRDISNFQTLTDCTHVIRVFIRWPFNRPACACSFWSAHHIVSRILNLQIYEFFCCDIQLYWHFWSQ